MAARLLSLSPGVGSLEIKETISGEEEDAEFSGLSTSLIFNKALSRCDLTPIQERS